jgi:hypothetical protein
MDAQSASVTHSVVHLPFARFVLGSPENAGVDLALRHMREEQSSVGSWISSPIASRLTGKPVDASEQAPPT